MYEKVSTKLNFVDREQKVLDFWKENQVFEKSVEETKDLPTYTFYDGVTTATYRPCAYTSYQGYDSKISDNEGP